MSDNGDSLESSSRLRRVRNNVVITAGVIPLMVCSSLGIFGLCFFSIISGGVWAETRNPQKKEQDIQSCSSKD